MLRAARVDLDASREDAFFTLRVPLFVPCVGAHRVINALEVLADLGALTLHLLASVEVDVALVAIARLVGVGKARIERGCLQDFSLSNCLW